MESELEPGQTFVHNGETYTVVQMAGHNVIATNSKGQQCLVSLAEVKKG